MLELREVSQWQVGMVAISKSVPAGWVVESSCSSAQFRCSTANAPCSPALCDAAQTLLFVFAWAMCAMCADDFAH